MTPRSQTTTADVGNLAPSAHPRLDRRQDPLPPPPSHAAYSLSARTVPLVAVPCALAVLLALLGAWVALRRRRQALAASADDAVVEGASPTTTGAVPLRKAFARLRSIRGKLAPGGGASAEEDSEAGFEPDDGASSFWDPLPPLPGARTPDDGWPAGGASGRATTTATPRSGLRGQSSIGDLSIDRRREWTTATLVLASQAGAAAAGDGGRSAVWTPSEASDADDDDDDGSASFAFALVPSPAAVDYYPTVDGGFAGWASSSTWTPAGSSDAHGAPAPRSDPASLASSATSAGTWPVTPSTAVSAGAAVHLTRSTTTAAAVVQREEKTIVLCWPALGEAGADDGAGAVGRGEDEGGSEDGRWV